MKRFFSFLLILLTAVVLTSCKPKLELTVADEDKTIALQVGQSATVTPALTEGFTLEWETDSASVATVTAASNTLSATINAVGVGTAKITLTVVGKDVSAEITVTVTRPDPTSVSITGEGNVALGTTLQLTGAVLPATAVQTLTWTSSDEAIATVSAAGLVTAVSAGEVTITATSTEDDTISDSVDIDVVVPQPTEVTVTGANEVLINESITLTATVAPQYAVQGVLWEVDDTTVASITSAGVLTGLKGGTVVVTATSLAKTTIKGTKTITVTLPDPTEVTVSGPTNVAVGETGTYSAVVAPALASQEVTWSVNDTTKATIDAATGVLTAVAKGAVKVTATSAVLNTVLGDFDVTIDPEKATIEMDLDGGYWPITGTDVFATGEPVATATLRTGYNPASADYYIAGTGSNHYNHIFLQDANRKIAPSVWQNRAFLNRNANGFFEVQVVKAAGSANVNPDLDAYEYTLYAHEAFSAGYSFIGALQVGQIITFSGFDINSQEVFEIGDVVFNVYAADQATSTADLVIPGETEVTLPVPGKLGANFGGWYANAEFTGDPVLTVNASTTVYAKWTYDYTEIAVSADVVADTAYYSQAAGAYFFGGENAFATLQEALVAVEAGGTVYVDAGTYDAAATVDKNNVTIQGVTGSIVSGAINVAANVDGLTIDGLQFTGAGKVALNVAGGIKNFTFKNNVVSDTTLTSLDTGFLYFKNDGTANNENFVIENNQFLAGASTDMPRWIRGGNILNLTVVGNVFEGLAETRIYVDAIRIEGTNETNSDGIGLGGEVLFESNEFNRVGQRGVWIRRISATTFDFYYNVLDATGGETAGGGLQIEVLVPETVLEVNIIENEFKNITHYFGIRLGTTAVPNLGAVTVKFNKFVDFTLATAYYVQGYAGATTIVADSNYFSVAPTADDMPNVSSYDPAFATVEELETAIAMSKPQTLTYESNGGTAVASEEVPGGFKATEPEDPTREGYTFAGWYKEATLTNAFDFAVDTISEPTTLYAKWTPIEYAITYNYNDGALAFATQADMFTAFLTDFHTFTESTDTLALFMDNPETATAPFDGTWQSKAGDPADYVYLNELYDGNRPDAPDAEAGFFITDPLYYAKWMPFLDMIQSFVKVVNAGQNFWAPDDTFVGLIRLPQFIKGVKPIASVSDAVMAQMPVYTTAHPTYNIAKVTTLPVPVKAGFVFAGWYDNAELTGEPMYEIPAGLMGEMALYAAYVADTATTGEIIVDPAVSQLYFGNKVVIDGKVFEVGVNYFANLVNAAEAVVTGDTVVVLPGTYTGDFAITVSDVTFVGPNALLDPNLDVRGEEAVVDGIITISKELATIIISGFKFTGQSQILNTAGTAAVAPAYTTNLDGFTFANNIVESALAAGDGMIYFVEAANSYSMDLVFANNYFTVVAEGSTLANMIRIDNNAGLDVVGNVFENIPGLAFFADDVSKGTAGNTYIADNAFINVTSDALRIDWISPLPSTTMGVVVENNEFDTVGGIAVYLGKMNNSDVLDALHVLHNEFKAVNVGVHMVRVHAGSQALVNYNKFLDVPTTTYIKDEKTAATPVTLDATKNAYLEDGKIITPDALKFEGSPDIGNPLTHAFGLNDFGNFEVSNNQFETNPFKLRIEFIADWNAKFETTFTNLNATAFFNSASIGAGGNATKDVSGSNIYKFFHDEVYGPKWAWLIDFLQTQGGIHPQRQLIAIEGNGTSPIPDSTDTYQLWNLSHSIYSFANFFNQAADTNGWAPIDFNVPSKYATVVDFNDKIYRNFGFYDMTIVGDVVKLPEALPRTNYTFVEYQEGTNVYLPGADYTITDNIVITAVYEAISYDVTFFDGETELTLLADTYTHEAAYSLPIPEKTGYLFEGWFDNALLEGTAVTSVAKGSTGDKVFYSKWLLLEYVNVDVTFELNGGVTGAYVEATRYSTAGDNAGAAITVGTSRGGLYWYVIGMKATDAPGVYEVLGKGTGYTNETATLYLSYHDGCTSTYKSVLAAEYAAAAAGDLIYIPWLPAAVTGTTSIDVLFLDSTITSVNKTMLLPADFPIMMVKTGSTFAGWYDNAAFTGEAVASYPGFEPGDSVTAITYYAKWEVNTVMEYNFDFSTLATNTTYVTTLTSLDVTNAVDSLAYAIERLNANISKSGDFQGIVLGIRSGNSFEDANLQTGFAIAGLAKVEFTVVNWNTDASYNFADFVDKVVVETSTDKTVWTQVADLTATWDTGTYAVNNISVDIPTSESPLYVRLNAISKEGIVSTYSLRLIVQNVKLYVVE
ncbi:MAG: InlB B-repeat-containing protein [Bacilli bacterium]|nr:InlB B-repeat-containing protein [Bacilli bacterium]